MFNTSKATAVLHPLKLIRKNYKRITILSFVLLLSLVVSKQSDAAYLCEWIGAADNSASNSSNWNNCNGTIPQDGDDVVFNGGPSCNWDFTNSPKVNSFTMNTGYSSSTVTLTKSLRVGTGGIYIHSGKLAAGNQIIELDGDWHYFNGQPVMLLGDVDGSTGLSQGDVDRILQTAMGGQAYYCSDINLDSSIDILDVVLTLRKSQGLDNPSETCKGGFFDPGTSTVKLLGGNQSINGDTIFYNLEKVVTTASTLTFEAGSTQTILGSLRLSGAQSNMLALKSASPGTQWNIDPFGSRFISYADIEDMNNLNHVDVIAVKSNDVGGNSGSVKFGGNQCVCLDKELLMTQVFVDRGRLAC